MQSNIKSSQALKNEIVSIVCDPLKNNESKSDLISKKLQESFPTKTLVQKTRGAQDANTELETQINNIKQSLGGLTKEDLQNYQQELLNIIENASKQLVLNQSEGIYKKSMRGISSAASAYYVKEHVDNNVLDKFYDFVDEPLSIDKMSMQGLQDIEKKMEDKMTNTDLQEDKLEEAAITLVNHFKKVHRHGIGLEPKPYSNVDNADRVVKLLGFIPADKFTNAKNPKLEAETIRLCNDYITAKGMLYIYEKDLDRSDAAISLCKLESQIKMSEKLDPQEEKKFEQLKTQYGSAIDTAFDMFLKKSKTMLDTIEAPQAQKSWRDNAARNQGGPGCTIF